MRTVAGFPRAQGIGRKDPALEMLRIEFTTETPTFDGLEGQRMLRASKRYYHREANRLLDVISSVAPGGLMVALLGELLYRYGNVYRVADPLPGSPALEVEAPPAATIWARIRKAYRILTNGHD